MKISWMPVLALAAATSCAGQSTISTLALKKTDGALAQFRLSDSPATVSSLHLRALSHVGGVLPAVIDARHRIRE